MGRVIFDLKAELRVDLVAVASRLQNISNPSISSASRADADVDPAVTLPAPSDQLIASKAPIVSRGPQATTDGDRIEKLSLLTAVPSKNNPENSYVRLRNFFEGVASRVEGPRL